MGGAVRSHLHGRGAPRRRCATGAPAAPRPSPSAGSCCRPRPWLHAELYMLQQRRCDPFAGLHHW